ncbi:MAG: tetratricopeptide repeat protein [Deltaproteobacteria bacterium]|nr:tetratricopeptide repeat protein [Deltaproteobacteria bacterium]
MGLIERLLSMLRVKVSPQSLTRKAAQYASREEVAKSVESYKQALLMDPLYVPAYDGLGKIYFRLGFREEAEREFHIAEGLEKLVKDSTDVDAAIKMGRAMFEKDMGKTAVSLLEPVLQKVPTHLELIKVLAVIYRTMGHWKRAIELYQTAVNLQPQSPEFYIELGEVEVRAGQEEEGQKLINYGQVLGRLQSNPGNASTLMEMARYHLANSAFNQAADFARQALKIDRQNQDYWLFLGDVYLRSGLYPAAVDIIRQAAKMKPADPRPQQLLATAYRLTGRLEESKTAKALAAMLESGQKETKTPQEAAKFIKHLLTIGQTEDAEKRLNQLLVMWPDNADLLIIRTRLLYKNKSYQEAINILKSIAAERGQWAEPHMMLAMCYQKLGDNMNALAEAQLSTRLAPKSHTVHKVLGDILREQKKFSGAENAYETADNLRTLKKDK